MNGYWLGAAGAGKECTSTALNRSSVLDRGIPVMSDGPIGGRVDIDAELVYKLHQLTQRLPAAVAHLEGTFDAPNTPKSYAYNADAYVF